MLEKACDVFTVNLLMPHELVKDMYFELGARREKIDIMAQRFGVSFAAMETRLHELKLIK